MFLDFLLFFEVKRSFHIFIHSHIVKNIIVTYWLDTNDCLETCRISIGGLQWRFRVLNCYLLNWNISVKGSFYSGILFGFSHFVIIINIIIVVVITII